MLLLNNLAGSLMVLELKKEKNNGIFRIFLQFEVIHLDRIFFGIYYTVVIILIVKALSLNNCPFKIYFSKLYYSKYQ